MLITERDMEDQIAADPGRFLGEPGLKLVARQFRIGEYRFDLLFEDRHRAKLIVEIQRGTLDRDHTYRILDYYHKYREDRPEEFIDALVVANQIPAERRRRLHDLGVKCCEIPLSSFSALAEPVCDLPAPADADVGAPAAMPFLGEEFARNDDPDDTPLHRLQRRFFEKFKEYLAARTPGLNVKEKPRYEPPHFLNLLFGRCNHSHFRLSAVALQNQLRTEVVVHGKDAEKNYAALKAQREDIERDLGEPMKWPNESKGKKRIWVERLAHLDNDERDWDEYFAWLVNRLEKLHQVFAPRVECLVFREDLPGNAIQS